MENSIRIADTDWYMKVLKIKNNKYEYFFKKGENDWYSIEHKTAPEQISKKNKIGLEILKIFNDIEYGVLSLKYDLKINSEEDITNFKNFIFEDIKKQLKENITTREENEKKENEKNLESIKEKYQKLYSYYDTKKITHDYTDLQFLSQICQGMGVGISDIILKVYITYLLTVLKIKATNVIAIGSQSSGKSFSIESALKMIPDEYVIKGVHTEAYFFGKFNGKNLDRYLFYLGDLGGVKDDEKTIVTRDILKQLNTDGYVERGIAPDSEPREESVEGNPAIVYSTVEETIINEQEKSRSNIVKPPDVSLDELTLFNAFYESPGKDWQTIETIEKDVESVKGLTWYLMENINRYEIFNPYMFCVSDFLRNMDDYNRKIKEFNKILLIVSLLNNPYELHHQYYVDEEYNPIDTTLVIASKQDIINALEIFDGANNLLPTEMELLKTLCKLYRPYSIDGLPKNTTVKEYEEMVMEELCEEDGTLIDYDYEEIDENNNSYPVFFTVSSVRRENSNEKSVKDLRKSLPEKFRKMYENNYIIKIGQDKKGENIYGLVYNIREKINNNIPVFRNDIINKAKQEFLRKYPDLNSNFETFIELDKSLDVNKINYSVNNIELYNVPWGK